MSSWVDLLNTLAKQGPRVRVVPPTLKYEDLWDPQRRIEVLEGEVKHLTSVLVAILNRLHEAEGAKE